MSQEGTPLAASGGLQYKALGVLGTGSYGRVVLCSACPRLAPAEQDGQLVAIKAFRKSSSQGLMWALREAYILQRLDHPNVVRLLDCFRSPSGRAYLVLDYVERCDQYELERHPCGLPYARVKLLAWQLCCAVRHLHARGIVHRDIKPTNVVCGSDGLAKLIDFGLARRLPAAHGSRSAASATAGATTTTAGVATSAGSPTRGPLRFPISHDAPGEEACSGSGGVGQADGAAADEDGGGAGPEQGAHEAMEALFRRRSQPGGALSSYVYTRWYRAPEVLLSRSYGPPADIWALGCTLAEYATGVPLFPGKTTADQLARIVNCRGHLPLVLAAHLAGATHVPVAAAARLCTQARGLTLEERLQRGGRDVWPHLHQVVDACLQLDPALRPTADELLRMPLFREVPALVVCHTSSPVLRRLCRAEIERQLQCEREAASAAASVAVSAAARTARTAAPTAMPAAEVGGSAAGAEVVAQACAAVVAAMAGPPLPRGADPLAEGSMQAFSGPAAACEQSGDPRVGQPAAVWHSVPSPGLCSPSWPSVDAQDTELQRAAASRTAALLDTSGLGSTHGTAHGTAHGSAHGSGHGTAHGSGHGSGYGSGHGSGYGSGYGPPQWALHSGAQHQPLPPWQRSGFCGAAPALARDGQPHVASSALPSCGPGPLVALGGLPPVAGLPAVQEAGAQQSGGPMDALQPCAGSSPVSHPGVCGGEDGGDAAVGAAAPGPQAGGAPPGALGYSWSQAERRTVGGLLGADTGSAVVSGMQPLARMGLSDVGPATAAPARPAPGLARTMTPRSVLPPRAGAMVTRHLVAPPPAAAGASQGLPQPQLPGRSTQARAAGSGGGGGRCGSRLPDAAAPQAADLYDCLDRASVSHSNALQPLEAHTDASAARSRAPSGPHALSAHACGAPAGPVGARAGSAAHAAGQHGRSQGADEITSGDYELRGGVHTHTDTGSGGSSNHPGPLQPPGGRVPARGHAYVGTGGAQVAELSTSVEAGDWVAGRVRGPQRPSPCGACGAARLPPSGGAATAGAAAVPPASTRGTSSGSVGQGLRALLSCFRGGASSKASPRDSAVGQDAAQRRGSARSTPGAASRARAAEAETRSSHSSSCEDSALVRMLRVLYPVL